MIICAFTRCCCERCGKFLVLLVQRLLPVGEVLYEYRRKIRVRILKSAVTSAICPFRLQDGRHVFWIKFTAKSDKFGDNDWNDRLVYITTVSVVIFQELLSVMYTDFCLFCRPLQQILCREHNQAMEVRYVSINSTWNIVNLEVFNVFRHSINIHGSNVCLHAKLHAKLSVVLPVRCRYFNIFCA